MAICKVCGTRFADGKRFCPGCGEPSSAANSAALSAPMAVCKICGTRYNSGKRFCPQCGAASGTAPAPGEKLPARNAYTEAAVQPMKWHHVLLALLILGGVLNVFGGILRISGQGYLIRGMDPNMVYGQFPRMKALDILGGIMGLGFGGFQFVLFRRLSRFRENGPNLLTVFYALYIVLSLLYYAAASASLGVSTFRSALLSLACTLVLLIVNRIYYGKREALFVN